MRLGHRFGTAYEIGQATQPRAARRATIAAYASALCLAALANTASARPCQTSADCPPNFRCEAIGETGCSAPAACPDGGTCASAPPCQASDVNVCVSPVCRGDTDCPNDMNCYRGQNGSSCIPRYLVACQRDDDCGEGFSCKEIISTRCPSGAATGGASACTTRRTGHYQCELRSKACSDATGCPNLFSCGPKPSAMACASDNSDDDAGTACAGDVCLPPYAAVDFALPSLAAPVAEGPNGHVGSGPSVRADYHHHDCAVVGPGLHHAALSGWLIGLGFGLMLAALRRRRW
jgi:hypothetical protein